MWQLPEWRRDDRENMWDSIPPPQVYNAFWVPLLLLLLSPFLVLLDHTGHHSLDAFASGVLFVGNVLSLNFFTSLLRLHLLEDTDAYQSHLYNNMPSPSGPHSKLNPSHLQSPIHSIPKPFSTCFFHSLAMITSKYPLLTMCIIYNHSKSTKWKLL